MKTKDSKLTFYAQTRGQWRGWLEENCQSEKAIWLILYHKKSTTATISYAEAIEEALCFGWIDSKAMKRDAESYSLFLTPRKPKSNWSKVNQERVTSMITTGLMTQHGKKLINIAKETGKWEIQSA